MSAPSQSSRIPSSPSPLWGGGRGEVPSSTSITLGLQTPAPATSERIAFHEQSTPGEVNRVQVFTLVLWLTCLAIGLLGLALPYARPRPPAPPEETIVQQLQ